MFKTAVLFSILTVAAATAHAATIVDFTGVSTGSMSTGSATITLAPDSLSFSGVLANTSPFDARITSFGFDLFPGNLNGFSGSPNPINTPSGVLFDFEDGDAGNVPQFNSAELDFAYLTGGSFNGGFPNDGLPPSQTLNFMISGNFAGLSESEIASGLLVRFQRVGPDGEGSDVANVTPIPEPASMLLFGTGLAVLARRRLRRGQAA